MASNSYMESCNGLLNDLAERVGAGEINNGLTSMNASCDKDIRWPKISIIIPSYNQGEFIERTLLSIIYQGYPRIEIIVIDGGSTDNTVDVLGRYSSFIAYWRSDKDDGQSHAVNVGVALATGELIGWQNADDTYYHGAFRHAALAYIRQPDSDVIYGNCWEIDFRGALLKKNILTSLSPAENFPYFKVYNQSAFYNKKTIARLGFLRNDMHQCMDIDMHWRYFLSGCNFVYVPEICGAFRVHENQKTQRQVVLSYREMSLIYENLVRHINRYGHAFDLKLQDASFGVAKACYRNDQFDRCNTLLISVLRNYGFSGFDVKMLLRLILSHAFAVLDKLKHFGNAITR